MAILQILAGDFHKGEGCYRQGLIHIETSLYPWPGLDLSASDIEKLETAGDDHDLALAGLSPLERKTTFTARFRDGRVLTCIADESVYRRIGNHVEAPQK
ncbi:hypothetical protein NJC40_03635 [Pseudomonas sp. 21LCFQ02]|uniref:hypothetical protein n=1 Tax=Pseudomonas sp. 21LCFQ02 TaxID=2957505 RepID=UPI00209BAA17|nr:hypothetical protein [Pseudomonas sp. 21LCFQ02]MCO8166870.1 hypothetical protein [Pseudomonas sp. 21LCFQ02]